MEDKVKNAIIAALSEKKMDPVDKDALKGSHADRKDQDIDNDGDVDDSDRYLHKRRKAVAAAMKEQLEARERDS